MKINEIFYSIQGEGLLSGVPTIFIRTTGCNLRCTYCDSIYAYEQGVTMTLSEILNAIKQYSCSEVCVTGGEPLIQKETLKLLTLLQDKGYHICLETNGSQNISNIQHRNGLLISLDIKCPSSGMHTSMDFSNLSALTKYDQLKFVIGTRTDYEYAKEIIHAHSIPCPIFFQPVWDTNPVQLAEWILQDALHVRLGLQLHKILWGDKQGV